MLWKSVMARVLMAVLGIAAGGVLAVVTFLVLSTAEDLSILKTDNYWSTTRKCNLPGNGILIQATCSSTLPMANVAQEAAYWTTTRDGTGQTLTGRHDYLLHFPAGQIPPNNAFWSVTLTDLQSRMVANPADRYSIGGTSDLAVNADGSVDIYIQNASPAGHEANWLPAPSGDFKLWLRAYWPGPAILNGTYQVPPVVEVR
jgi:hypothetical protein